MVFQLAVILFTLLGASSWASLSRPNADSFNAKLDKWVRLSRQGDAACSEFQKSLAQMKFEDQIETLQSLKTMSAYPTTPPSTGKAIRLLLSGIPSGTDFHVLAKKWVALRGPCAPKVYLDSAKKLILHSRLQEFELQERIALSVTLLGFLKRETAHPAPIVAQRVYVGLLKLLLDNYLLEDDPRIRPAIRKLADELETLQTEMVAHMGDGSAAQADGYLANLLVELNGSEKLRLKTVELLKLALPPKT